VVVIPTRLMAGAQRNCGFIPRKGKVLLLSKASSHLWGPQSLLFNGYDRLFPLDVKRPGHEDDCSRNEVKNKRSCTSITP
jgi:hypothetical protein